MRNESGVEPVRVLVLGAGRMGRAHVTALKAAVGVDVVGVVSRRGDSAARLAADFRIPWSGSDWWTAVKETEPRACIVAVSHTETEQITREVIEGGFHVLAEKPVAFRSEAVRALATLAQTKGVLAMAAMNRRFFPSVSAAVDLVRFHGPVLGVTVVAPDPVRPYRAQRLYDEVVYRHWMLTNTLHAIDLLRMVGGDPDSVTGESRWHDDLGESSTVAVLRFESGMLGSYISHPGASGDWELRVYGDGVEAHLKPLERGTLRIGAGAPRPLPDSRGTDLVKPGLKPQLAAFVEGVQDLGYLPPPASGLADHARSVALAEALQGLGSTARQGS